MSQSNGLPPDDDWNPTDDDAPDAPPAGGKPAPAARARAPHLEVHDGGNATGWMRRLRWTKPPKGVQPKPERCLENVRIALAHCPEWHGVLRYNEMADRVELVKRLPQGSGAPAEYPLGQWRDHYAIGVVTWVHERLGLEYAPQTLDGLITELAHRSTYHPVREYLTTLRWDGTLRLPGLLSGYFGTEATALNAAMGSRWMVSAVARVMRPGCQADHMLVLEGKQGSGKTTGIHALVGEQWVCSSPVDLANKDAAHVLRGCWVYDFDELDAIRGKDATRVKSFVTLACDRYRPAYGRHVVEVPRSCVFVGTTNESQYLHDATGNRRFWPVRCGSIDVPGLARDRDQLWAEAVQRYEGGAVWHLDTSELTTAATAQQEERVSEDPWLELIQEWWHGNLRKLSGVSTRDALEALGVDPAQQGKRELMRAADCFKAMGLEQRGNERPRLWRPKQQRLEGF